MATKRGLGRGLDAILQKPDDSVRARELPVDLLEPNRYQPRADFAAAGLEELAASIAEKGVIQPIIVSPEANGRYVIVAGERRWRAARMANLAVVPVVVRDVSGDGELLELALVENVQRADLNGVEEAEAYRVLRESFGLSQEEIGKRVGRARSTITNALRLLRLPPRVLDLLRQGLLSAGQARPLLSLESSGEQIRVAELAIRDELSARQIEAMVGGEVERRSRRRRPARLDPHVEAAAEKLTQAFRTKVEIRRRGRRGTVLIHFHSEEELMRLYDQLLRKGGTE